ncbi:MAG TPA: hypothetical protein VLH75_16355 [Longimicrobiales bacterium]|nr:hypothetical protein [Longimicrobiales bacterium]
MSAHWIRTPPEPRDDVAAALVAGALAVGVGLAAFWITRLFLARERLPEGPAERPRRPSVAAPEGPG